MSKPVTFDLNDPAFQAIVQQAVAAALAAKTAAEPAKPAKASKADETAQAAIKAFKRAGYADVQPHVNVLTYSKWLQQGRKVKAGEKAIKAKNLRLFHVSQTEPIAKAEAEALLAQKAAKATSGPSASKLPSVSPVAPAAPVAPGKATRKGKSGEAVQQPSA
ncbi:MULTISPECIES: hypothetical protein [unclassified Bradyrhizobium]|uniref:hypothetical protein n=1 Tax=unclassified Bradyrhizobium TaxID=2631580 RepID=UPI0029166EDA|nr:MULTISPECIES: hypothetical protein [unclassified Bradyrhizobium]